MTGAGEALMGIGEARGPDRALRAAQLAVKNPLLEDVSIDGAKGVITNIVGSRDITLHEVGEAMNYIYSACPEAHVFYGHALMIRWKIEFRSRSSRHRFPRRATSAWGDE